MRAAVRRRRARADRRERQVAALARVRERADALGRENRRLRDETRTLRRQATDPRGAPVYNADGLAVWGKNVSFLADPAFLRSYRRGIESEHGFERGAAGDPDIHVEWRVHVACWAGWHARRLPGDFVECGVNTGIFSLAVCEFVDFNSLDKDFFLFDTFAGIPEDQMAPEERGLGARLNLAYEDSYEIALRNFEPFPRARLVRGRVPDSLESVRIERVCYLSIDMNVAAPERAALEHFWPRLAAGAPVLLDDYAWADHSAQKEALDDFARSQGVEILTLPTGQGLLLRP